MFRRFTVGASAAIIVTASFSLGTFNVSSTSKCDDVKIIWANGSGAVIDGTDNNYLDFRNAVKNELQGLDLDYEFYELGSMEQNGHKYPAVGIGIDSVENFFTALGAFVSGGESYSFGESVQEGVWEVESYMENISKKCPKTKFVLGGLSQGAEVISKSLAEINPEKIIYATTFGDPKLYLPEGYGKNIPKACINNTKSDYRDFVPDCWVYEGILGGLRPYEPEEFKGKLGAYCNHFDVFCTGRINWLNLNESTSPHGSYGNSFNADHIYEIAARKIYNKIAEEKIKEASNDPEISTKVVNNIAILIDTTGSMTNLIDDYKNEALNLARKVWESGGEVALFEYRDISDPFEPKMRCGFTDDLTEKCSEEAFVRELNSLECSGGGDEFESALSASMFAMNKLKWTNGAHKATVILSDTGFHDVEIFHGETIDVDAVVKRSFEIDPVIFYAITPETNQNYYSNLTEQTGGKVFRSENEIPISTNEIFSEMEKYPLRPEIEVSKYNDEDIGEEVEIIETKSVIKNDNLNIDFSTNAYKTLVILNDTILGYRDENNIIIKNLDYSRENIVKLVPYNANGYPGTAKTVKILKLEELEERSGNPSSELPLAPDCGMARV